MQGKEGKASRCDKRGSLGLFMSYPSVGKMEVACLHWGPGTSPTTTVFASHRLAHSVGFCACCLCARGEIATGGRGHSERAHDVGPIINPVALLLSAAGG